MHLPESRVQRAQNGGMTAQDIVTTHINQSRREDAVTYSLIRTRSNREIFEVGFITGSSFSIIFLISESMPVFAAAIFPDLSEAQATAVAIAVWIPIVLAFVFLFLCILKEN